MNHPVQECYECLLWVVDRLGLRYYEVLKIAHSSGRSRGRTRLRAGGAADGRAGAHRSGVRAGGDRARRGARGDGGDGVVCADEETKLFRALLLVGWI